MNYLPSKELLSEVLDNEVPYQVKVHKIIIKNNSLNYFYNSKDSGSGLFEANEYINIYELASKCKVWATENKYTILTEDMHPNGYFAYVLSNKESIENYGYLCEHKVIKDIPHNKTEPEAIFAACQWILDNRS